MFRPYTHMMKFLLLIISVLVGCSSGATDGARFKKGDCIELPWGAYVYQVADANDDTYFLYKVGYMGKEIVPLPFEEAHKNYIKTTCR